MVKGGHGYAEFHPEDRGRHFGALGTGARWCERSRSHGGANEAVLKMLKEIGDYHFFPIVPTDHNEIAELEIIMLRPGQGPGSIIAEGGDIDNRLKTLFDSLTIPKKSEIPPDDKPEKSEDPFYCLLEDDILIANLSVATDRLLEPGKSEWYVKLIIRVQIKSVPTIGASRMSILIRH